MKHEYKVHEFDMGHQTGVALYVDINGYRWQHALRMPGNIDSNQVLILVCKYKLQQKFWRYLGAN